MLLLLVKVFGLAPSPLIVAASRPLAPPYVKVRPMPMAPMASRRSASRTMANSGCWARRALC